MIIAIGICHAQCQCLLKLPLFFVSIEWQGVK
jgi:hypothetical protein